MVKRRTPVKMPVAEDPRVEAFAAQADNPGGSLTDPDAPRSFKKINVPFNEYEFKILEEATKRAGRSKLNFIRFAILEASKHT